MATKRVKLRIHPKTFCEEDLIVNIDALKLQLAVGDVIELAPCTENGQTPQSGPFLQIETVPQELQSKGGPLSISREIAGAFSLEGVREVRVKRVEREEVGLDLVELRIKDQCLTRSDMWRFTSSLADKFVHTGKKLDYAGVRVTVSRLWSQQGAVVLSGAVLSRTRVVFRSASVQLVLYIQISAEMWHFDPSGDLYFDKAVGGFLKELFQHWQDEGCNHEVTLLFFWRAFYDKSTMEGLSEDVKSSVQRDKRGRNYEDFYKVIAGGESFADWSSKLVDIKRTFTHLKTSLVKERGEGMELSSAAEGNVLEAINLALNLFQKHYMDCSFSMTGHQVIIVTAGAGIFEVDHELTRLTNERIISGGVATDLVCLTDQPLHAVPLLKFQDGQDNSDYYHIPYWINYSFYSPSHSRNWFRFQPRLQLSDHLVNAHLSRSQRRYKGSKLYNPFIVTRSSDDSRSKALEDRLLNRVDCDEYDASVFSLTPNQGVKPQMSSTGRPVLAKTQRSRYHSTGESAPRQSPPPIRRDLNDPFDDSEPLSQSPGARSIGSVQIAKENPINTSFDATSLRRIPPTGRFMTEEPIDSSVKSGRGFLVGSAESLHHLKPSDIPTRRNRSLINPFNPKLQHTDLTAHHRRWSHVFPRDKAGVAFQVHHVIKEESQDMSHDLHRSSSRESAVSLKSQPHFENQSLASSSGLMMSKATDSIHLQEDHYSDPKQSPILRVRGKGDSPALSVRGRGDSPQLSVRGKGNSPQLSIRGINTTSSKLPSENFASARRQGADWRSLTEPACLPVTTDYFPGQKKLANEFYEYHTTMVASTYSYRGEESSGEKSTPAWITDHQDVSTFQVFSEMISQRISQGFQLVFEPHGRQKGGGQETIFSVHKALTQLHEEVANRKKRGRLGDVTVRLSLGRVFQLMKLNYPDLVVWTYKPKSREVTLPISYTYQVSTATGSEFMTQQAEFCHTHTEDYNWNYLDQHICGYPDFEELGESQKYWRCRYLLLPSGTTAHSHEGVEHWASLIANFVRFIEFLNHIKRGDKPGSRQSSLGVGGLKRQVSLPASIASGDMSTSSRVSTPFEPQSNPHSPLPRSGNRLSEIQEEKQPQSPRPDRQRAPDNGLKFSEFLSNRPTSPYLASSQPKSESRKGGINSSSSMLSVKSDTNRKHRRTSSHDADLQRFKEIDPKLKMRGSPQLLRKTQGGQAWKQEPSGSKTTSPSHSKNERKVTKKSNDGGMPIEVTPPTPSEDSVYSIASERSTGTSLESFYQIPLLNSSSPVQLIATAMASSEDGIDFLSNLPGLKSCCFVAMEAVSWVFEKISGVQSRGEAVKLLQCMVQEDLVIHASGDLHIPFIDGYFLYQLPLRDSQEPPPTDPHKDKDNVDKSFVFVEPMDYEKFTKRWFEVRVHHPLASTDESTLLTVGASPSSMTSFPASLQRSGAAPYYMHFEGKEHGEIPSSMLNRFVEMNPDPQTRSDRPEWCYVRYDHAYRPQCAFQLEFQWMVATMNLLNQLIQNWVSKATRCGFSLVPAPMIPSLTATSHPFSQQQFIPLRLPPTFPYWSCDTTPLYKLFNSLLTKFSFLLDPATLPQSSDVLFSHYSSGEFTSRLFIHTSGVAFVQPFCDLDESEKATMSHDKQKTAAVDIKGGLRETLRQLSVPIGSSTPVGGSPNDGLYIPPIDGVKGQSRCGFYWYRNYLLLRQNATSQENHGKVLRQLTEFCTDADGGLTELCNLMDYDTL